MKNLKSENGSITSLVIVTVLFFVTILSTSYMVVNALRKSQLKSQINAKDVYERDLKRVDEIVAELENRKNKVWPEPKEENETINGEVGNAYNPTIPAGYVPINTDSSKWGDGTTTPTTDAVDYGLVIKDKKDNEWVWIPVSDVTVMCDIYNTTEYTLTGTSVKTKLYSKSEIISGETRTTPGTNADPFYREPDLVTGREDTGQDAMYYQTMLGFDSKEQMAETFVENYTKMIESIKEYGGFYIGRYELSEAGVQKNQPTITKINWYDSYKKCQELKASEKVKTEMIWGCQWDATCKFIANKGEKKNITDSRTWGNYNNSEDKAAVVVTENGVEVNKFGVKQNTGYSEYWKANNIYDFAGNCSEWTQEATKPAYRENRGGVCVYDGSKYPALCRGGNTPDYNTGKNRRYSSNFNNKIIKPN